jgi:hypothetical protein
VTNASQRKQETLLYAYPLHWVILPTKRTTKRWSSPIYSKQGRHSDYWNRSLNMRMRVCYQNCYAAELCCYLVMHIENLLRPLQLFYFHLWPVYCLSLVK